MTDKLDSSPQKSTTSYHIPVPGKEVVYEIKKSRFIARVGHVSTKEAAKIFIAAAKQDYPDARHHCWAYQFGPPHSPYSAAMSDDGEPKGTAGKPIHNVLQHKNIGDIMIIVIRYFGGIKLGAGGLVRAYSQAAQLAIDNLVTKEQVTTIPITIHCDFSQEQTIRHWLATMDSTIDAVEYQQLVVLRTQLSSDNLSLLEQRCKPLGISVLHDHMLHNPLN